ncbi:MAG TPA: hypothetical protein VFW83_10225, partial [Bryobacteraceae bacterium]|nr:hypothetical protein [Bryobacteraceae bacterium]
MIRFQCGPLLLLLVLFAGFSEAQPALRLKTRRIVSARRTPVAQIQSPVPFGRGHLILQFNAPPSADTVAALKARGISVLQDVPENGLLVAVDRTAPVAGLGVRYAGRLDPRDKISPLLARISSLGPAASDQYLLAEFHPDIDLNDARALVSRLGLVLSGNPDLGPRQLLIHTGAARLDAAAALLAAQDEVAYVFPASSDLASGTPVRPCAGAITTNGT